MRKPIPERIQREVLFRNEAVCCICQKSNIQIHHIDKNHRNNELSNLCVLCIEHHAQASSTSEMIKGLSASLLKRFKSDWENRIRRKRLIIRRKGRGNKEERDYIRFELKRLIYYLPTERTKLQVNKNIDQIYHWHLLEGYSGDILKNLSHVQWFLSGWQKVIVSERLYEFFWQFIDPKKVRLEKSDERELLNAIALLGDFGSHEAFLDQSKKTVESALDGLADFYDIGKLYRRKNICSRVIDELVRARKEWGGDVPTGKKKTLLAFINHKLSKIRGSHHARFGNR